MTTTGDAPFFPEQYLRADKGPKILAIIIVFPSLALITVTLRLYTRFRIVHNPSWEDFAIFLALVRINSQTSGLMSSGSCSRWYIGLQYRNIDMSRLA